MPVEIKISPQTVCDLVVTAFEGGSNHWVRTARKERGPETEERPWYSDPKFYEGDLWLIRIYIDDKDEPLFLGSLEAQKGLQLMANKYPDHFSDVITENMDAITADVWLHCALLGEMVYG